MVKKIAVLLLSLALLMMLAVSAYAHPVPDLSQSGSIAFRMRYDGKDLENGKLNLYKVGEVTEVNGDFLFTAIDAFAGLDLDYGDIENFVFAQELLTSAKEAGLEKVTAPIRDGKAVFETVEPGLYVVWQDGADATKGFAAITPFLISMPRFQDGQYVTEVEADPKVGFETIPPTTKPSDEKIPQTGQLNWPVPVLAISGAVLFLAGFVLWTGRKRV